MFNVARYIASISCFEALLLFVVKPDSSFLILVRLVLLLGEGPLHMALLCLGLVVTCLCLFGRLLSLHTNHHWHVYTMVPNLIDTCFGHSHTFFHMLGSYFSIFKLFSHLPDVQCCSFCISFKQNLHKKVLVLHPKQEYVSHKKFGGLNRLLI